MHTNERRPICFQCGQLGTRWFQPLIGTENFCSVQCAQAYTGAHRFTGEAQAIHTDACSHYAPDGRTEESATSEGCGICGGSWTSAMRGTPECVGHVWTSATLLARQRAAHYGEVSDLGSVALHNSNICPICQNY